MGMAGAAVVAADRAASCCSRVAGRRLEEAEEAKGAAFW
jgi:hypothetical protein